MVEILSFSDLQDLHKLSPIFRREKQQCRVRFLLSSSEQQIENFLFYYLLRLVLDQCLKSSKMNKRNCFKILIFAVYVALIVVFLIFAKEKKEKDPEEILCLDSPCVRLCSSDQETSLRNSSIDTIELTHPTTNLSTNFHILDDKPCENMRLLETDQWTFSSVS